jgi:hypothetical protein
MEVSPMPIQIVVDHELKEVKTIAIGPIAIEDIRSHLAEEREGGGLAYREFVDASGAEPVVMNTTDARTVVELLKALAEKGRLGPTAVIVPNDLGYGLLRMVEILLEGVAEVRPFRKTEKAEARAWLKGVR